MKLASGEYANVVYETEARKKTLQHRLDLSSALDKAGVELYKPLRLQNDWDNVYRMTDKNRFETCFDDYKTIFLW